MSLEPIVRPIARSFKQEYAKNAAIHIRAGGHAFIWESKSRVRFVFRRPAKDNPDDFGAWGVYDMGKSRWSILKNGALKGFASIVVPADCRWIAKRRVERDSIYPGHTRKIELDCTKCAACCRDNEVILQPADVARFREGGRPELAKPPYAKRHKDGRLILTLLPNKRCHHLRRDHKCGIYTLRPHPCSEFPAGSECCLFAREDVLELYDGLAPEA
ncbi:MAG: YkgJ family cysteine cluster protein [Polyangiaceae bacterium]|nr:YkgJ family cysteine cluster protein [Polyangiaceae bacterium]